MSFGYVTSVLRILPKPVVGVHNQLGSPSVSNGVRRFLNEGEIGFLHPPGGARAAGAAPQERV